MSGVGWRGRADRRALRGIICLTGGVAVAAAVFRLHCDKYLHAVFAHPLVTDAGRGGQLVWNGAGVGGLIC